MAAILQMFLNVFSWIWFPWIQILYHLHHSLCISSMKTDVVAETNICENMLKVVKYFGNKGRTCESFSISIFAFVSATKLRQYAQMCRDDFRNALQK